MPTMVRPDNKARKIFYEIVGQPENMTKQKPKKTKIERKIDFEDTRKQ